MRNAAGGGELLAPGGLFRLYGSGLAAGKAQAAGTPWPRQLGGVSVLVNGRAAPSYYVSENQINGQIGYETAFGPATVEVRTPAGRSAVVGFEVTVGGAGGVARGGATEVK
jgi:uncharacterized protein (TIGR03437 family)